MSTTAPYAPRAATHDAMDLMASKVSAVDSRLRTLQVTVDQGFDALGAEIRTVDAKVEALSGTVKDLSGKFEDLSGKFDDLSGKFVDLSRKTDDLSGKTDDLSRKTDRLTVQMTEVNSKVATLDDNFLHLNQKLDRILGYLAKKAD
jgi:outer membrane murein-binding lipoprotein Lpp